MELNEFYAAGASASKSGVYTGSTPGLSSPNQLVNFTASVSVALDQTAAGSGLILIGMPATDRATRLAQIRRGSFERLGNAWRILADR